MWEDLSLEEYVMGEEKFNEKGAGFYIRIHIKIHLTSNLLQLLNKYIWQTKLR